MTRFALEQETHGAGGFAKVIKGRDTTLDRDVAVKIFDPLLSEFGPAEQERFRREAKILAKLSHPNIPAIYDVDFTDSELRIIFQFIEGRTLKQLTDEEGPIQVTEARTWFHQLASAIQHAHSLGIVHRDIKPDNVIITANRESAYLVDFGIAVTTEDGKKLTKTGFVIGTPGYMSPEQLAGEQLDGKADIYSLAVTLYETLAGKRLNPGPNYEALHIANETIPPQIDELILACLENRLQRLDSVKTFSTQLTGALSAPARPLSEVLNHGKLHELSLYLDQLSALDIINLPAGQRDLLLAKILDVVVSNEENLEYASERFLQLMLTRGILLPKEDYKEIVVPAVEWASEKPFGKWMGKQTLRTALDEAASEAHGEAHAILRDEITELISRISLDDKEGWYLHALREVIQSIMSNPACVDGSTELKKAFREINKKQRAIVTTLLCG